jgi:Putative transposase
VLGWYRRRARRVGWADGHSGSVTVIQRFGSGLQVNVHAHALVLDGVFTEAADGTLRFHPAPAPTDLEVARLVTTLRTRVLRLLRRRGVFLDPEDDDTLDPLAETSLALAGITNAAVQGRSALGPRVGARVLQLGRVPGAPWVTATGSRQAHLDGFDLHANVAVAANNRDGLEQLARYVLRPPIAQERLTRTADGGVLLTLKAEWRDGTTHLLFEPIELLERLAALTPRPRINLVLHHGVLAAHSRWRARAVAYGRGTLGSVSPDAAVGCGTAAPPIPPRVPWSDGRPEASGASQRHPVVTLGEHQSEPLLSTPVASRAPANTAAVEAPPPPAARKWSWPELMRHTFAVDVLACPGCGGRMRVVATIEDPVVIRKILTHLGLPTETSVPRPPPSDLFDWS